MKRRLIPYALIAPAFTMYVIFHLIPLGLAARLSFFKSNFVKTTWVGLKHYINFFTSEELLVTFYNTFIYIGLIVPAQLAVAVAMSLMIYNTGERFQNFTKVTCYLPGLVGGIVLSATWAWVFSSDMGLANQIAYMLAGKRVAWFANRWLSVIPIAGIEVMMGLGTGLILFTATLKSIPRSVIDAAMIDGCNWRMIKFKILLPHIWQTIILVALLKTIATFQLYYMIHFLAPYDYAGNLMFRMYTTSFIFNKYGKGSAYSMILMALILIFAIFQMRVMKRER